MAYEALKKLGEQLTCAICLDTYKDPKLLHCLHVFCTRCLVLIVTRDQQGQLSLSCPTCRHVIIIPANGVRGLPSAFHINHLLEIKDSFKKVKEPELLSIQDTSVKGDVTGLVPQEKAPLYCLEHFTMQVELYCETCRVFICLKCVIKGGKHHSHDCHTMEEASEIHREEVLFSLDPMGKKLEIIGEALLQLDLRQGEILEQRETIEGNIHDYKQQLQKALDLRTDELICDIHQMTHGKLKGLAAQRDHLETIQAQLSSCMEFVKNSLETGSGGGILERIPALATQVEELTTQIELETLVPNVEANTLFLTSSTLTVECQKYGNLTTPVLDPSQCHIVSETQEVANVEEKYTLVMQAMNSNSAPYTGLINTLHCELQPEVSEIPMKGSVERDGESRYTISFLPANKGRHQVSITVQGHHIRGSPFALAVKLPVEKLSTPILSIGGMNKPFGVAVNKKGELIVSEGDGDCVSVFSPSGDRLFSFGVHGSGKGEFINPKEVTLDGEENILVVDNSNNRIQKFSQDGSFLGAVGVRGNGPLQFNSPWGIAFNTSNNKIYVTEYENNRVQVINTDFSYFSSFGMKGSSLGQFSSPCSIACDNTGKVYVADTYNHRIQIFTSEGVFVKMFGGRGWNSGNLTYPAGVAIDSGGRMYVSENGNHRVSVFTSECQFLSFFGKYGDKPGELHFPYGLTVDESGVVYVCDTCNNKVKLF